MLLIIVLLTILFKLKEAVNEIRELPKKIFNQYLMKMDDQIETLESEMHELIENERRKESKKGPN